MRPLHTQAQRDYHPDRNAGVARASLDRSSEEWEVLCLGIAQQLAIAKDGLTKKERRVLSSKLSWSSKSS